MVNFLESFQLSDLYLQSNQVKRTPQNNINELIIWILNPLVVSRMQEWIDYFNIKLASHFKSQYYIDFF